MSNYNIGKLVSFKHIKKGFANRVFYLKTTKGEYILKISIRNNYNNRFKYEINLLEHLKNKDLLVPEIIKLNNGALFFRWQGYGIFIYKYLHGKQVNKFSRSMLRQIGELLAKIHIETANFKSSVRRIELYNLSPDIFKRQAKLSRNTKDRKILKAVDYYINSIPNYFLHNSLPEGAMHIDFKPENTLFLGGKISGLVDFDNSYNGPLVFDLAHTIMWYCGDSGRFDIKKVKIIYDAYNRVRKLKLVEKNNILKALYYSVLVHSFVDIYFYVHKKELDLRYVYWGIDNFLPLHGYVLKNEYKFKRIFK